MLAKCPRCSRTPRLSSAIPNTHVDKCPRRLLSPIWHKPQQGKYLCANVTDDSNLFSDGGQSRRPRGGAHISGDRWNSCSSNLARSEPKHSSSSSPLHSVRVDGSRKIRRKYTLRISDLGKARQWKKALALADALRTTEGVDLDAGVYGAAIGACNRATAWVAALGLFASMQNCRIYADAAGQSAAMAACGRGSSWQSSLAVFREALRSAHSGYPADAACVATAIRACAHGSAWTIGLELLQVAEHANWPLDAACYNIAMDSCGNHGAWQQSLQILQQMQSSSGWRVAADQVSYNAASAACRKASRWELTLSILEEGRRVKLEPDAIGLSIAISACGAVSLWNRALALLADVKLLRVEANVVNFNTVITACGRAGRDAQVFQLFEDMRMERISPTVVSYGACISACENMALWPLATRLMSDMQVACIRPDDVAISAMISVLAKGYQWESACVRLQELVALFFHAGIPNSVLQYGVGAASEACARSSKWQEAAQLVILSSARWGDPGTVALNAAIEASGQQTQLEVWTRLTNKMRRRSAGELVLPVPNWLRCSSFSAFIPPSWADWVLARRLFASSSTGCASNLISLPCSLARVILRELTSHLGSQNLWTRKAREDSFDHFIAVTPVDSSGFAPERRSLLVWFSCSLGVASDDKCRQAWSVTLAPCFEGMESP